MAFFNQIDIKNKLDRLKIIGEAKKKMGVRDLCGNSQSQSIAYCLTPFVEEVMKLKFHEDPDYNKLRFLLEVVLLK